MLSDRLVMGKFADQLSAAEPGVCKVLLNQVPDVLRRTLSEYNL